ncbi:ComF family protein [Listeria innocua]|uniref:ComF family protein n=1 Tax=Listeria innocua TaxID=1642 RepID=UPI001A99C315|nr:ComF family protein [Listeria innocua]EAF5658649.1 ComF family protein [Listeria innocua]UPH51234.1 ComF family protein [Listeria innocua]UPH62965.1 ComF family protein [Listeria innocua]
MINCLLCLQPVKQAASWESSWLFSEEVLCCTNCLVGFEKLTGPLCNMCSKESSDEFCKDCQGRELYLNRNRSLYQYNDFAKEYMKRFKFQGDYIIGAIFQKELKKYFAASKMTIVPIPVSGARKLERGFNQTTAILKQSDLRYQEFLAKKHSEKQSKKTKRERLETEQVFYLSEEIGSSEKEIILFDDIYTTGSTLNLAAQVLKESGVKKVSSLTIFR